MKKIIMLLFILPLLLYSEIPLPKKQKRIVPDSFKHYRHFPLGGEHYEGDLFTAPQLKIEEQKKPGIFCIKAMVFDYRGRTYSVCFSPGASEDPNFIFSVFDGEKAQEIRTIYAERIYLGAAGYIYSETRTNNYFLVKRKFLLKDKKITEIKQPFLLVDMQCHINEKTVIKMTPDDKSKSIAALPKGAKVKVLLAQYFADNSEIIAEEQWYLISTSFGLVGWVKSKPSNLDYPSGKPLSCIWYMGD